MKGILCKGVNYFLSKPDVIYQGELNRSASLGAVNAMTDQAGQESGP